MAFIDLSVPLNEKTPYYEDDPVTKIEPHAVLAKDGYADHTVSFGTHTGTHMDAPCHMVEGGKTLDQFPVEKFVGKGKYIKVEKRKFDLETVKAAGIEAGDIVLFDTGMNAVYHEQAYYDEYPGMPEEIAQYLVDQGVKIVGVDMCSPDHEPFPTHKKLLSNEVLIIENLTNLSQLEGKDFTVYALPIHLQVEAAPARVIAEVK